jgi:hypothetical protein
MEHLEQKQYVSLGYPYVNILGVSIDPDYIDTNIAKIKIKYNKIIIYISSNIKIEISFDDLKLINKNNQIIDRNKLFNIIVKQFLEMIDDLGKSNNISRNIHFKFPYVNIFGRLIDVYEIDFNNTSISYDNDDFIIRLSNTLIIKEHINCYDNTDMVLQYFKITINNIKKNIMNNQGNDYIYIIKKYVHIIGLIFNIDNLSPTSILINKVFDKYLHIQISKYMIIFNFKSNQHITNSIRNQFYNLTKYLRLYHKRKNMELLKRKTSEINENKKRKNNNLMMTIISIIVFFSIIIITYRTVFV